MRNAMYQTSQFVIGIIEKMMANSITFSGEENLNKEIPTLFVANHFTRVETFLIPYVLYKKMGFKVRSLADHSIFNGALGKYLRAVGTVSTKDSHRNEKILGDLLTARENWMIYPEGSMIKSQKILLNDDSFMIENANTLKNIYTGSAVLALTSELEKSRYFEALNHCKIQELRAFKEKYFIKDEESISYHNTHIVPINISYSPIRFGENSLSEFAHKYLNSTSKRFEEELEIESNILLHSQLHIHFSKSIDIKDFLLQSKRKYVQIHKKAPSDTEIIEEARVPLTNAMMNDVYKNTLLTFDHIFALTLEYMQEKTFTIYTLKTRIYFNIVALQTLHTYRLDSAMLLNTYTLLNDEKQSVFDDILHVSIMQNILIEESKDSYSINTTAFKNEYTFHTIRIKNILRVLLNQTMILQELHTMIKHNASKDIHLLHKEVFFTIYRQDYRTFIEDYNIFYSVFESKPKEIGQPFILFDEQNTIGCIISHGYKSAPKEIEPLAHYLFDKGINIYATRLKGHGTMPEDLRDSTYQQWYNSFDKGYSALRGVSEKLFVCGFSTGGLLALLKASNTSNTIDGIICINTALALQDIRVKYLVPTLNVINNFLTLFHAAYDTYESEPEHPEINYKMHYLTSIGELKKLIDITNDRLKDVHENTLIIQADEDPIVNPNSANILFESISSHNKEKYIVHSKKHVIPLEKSINIALFDAIVSFITDLTHYKIP